MKKVIWTFVLFWSIPLTTGADVTVTCFFTGDCVLPCRSTYHNIQWYKAGRENAVHIFIDNEDHLDHQDAAFRGRTSLFTDLISEGNVSLLLREIRVEDEGIYTCFTPSSSEELEIIIRLEVQAPIIRVDIKFTDEELTCNTSKVYPKPEVSWYENNSLKPNVTTETQEDEQGLFSLRSRFTHKTQKHSSYIRNRFKKQETTFTCSISFGDRSQNYTARLRQEKVDIYSGQDAVIHCPVRHGDAGNHTITLRYKESVTVLKSQITSVTQPWAGTDINLTYDGNVRLHKLDMDKHTGNYTCEMVTDQSTTEVVRTSVQIISDIHNNGIVEVLGAAVIFMGIKTFIIYYLCDLKNKKQRNSRQIKKNEELEQELESKRLLSEETSSSDTYSSDCNIHRK